MTTLRQRRGALLVAGAVAGVLLLAGCGSNVDPDLVALTGGTRGGSDVPVSLDAGADASGADGSAGGIIAPDAPDGADAGPAPGDGSPRQGGAAEQTAPGQSSQPGTPAGTDCSGLADDTGLDADTLTIGNTADISGPVPGLFEESQKALQAFVAYFNASGATVCGRSLRLVTYDSRTDGGADQQAYTQGCDEVFAMVGSMSGFDAGGAATAQDCGLPDIRAISTTAERTACTTCYAAQPAGPEEFQNAVPDFIMRNYDGGQKAAMLYLNGGAASDNGPSQVRFSEQRGMHYVYVQSVDLTEFNYAPYVQAMKDRGVETVQFVGANPQFVRLAQAMEQQDFHPRLYLLDPTAYSPQYTDVAGDAAVGTVVFLNFTPFEEAQRNPELALYLDWLERVSPGSTPGFFGLFSWSAARLFVERATSLGKDLSRSSLVASMSKVDDWTSNGLHSPQHVAAKRIADCWRFVQWTGSTWKPLEGTRYQCHGTTS